MAVRELLLRSSVGELVVDKKELHQVSSETNIEQVVKLLHEKNITSIPVYDPQQKKYVSIVSIYDILAFVCISASFAQKNESLSFTALDDTQIHEILGLAKEGKIPVFEASTPLLEIAQLFCTEGGIHRILVHVPNAEENLRYRMLTQLDFVGFLVRNEKLLGEKISLAAKKLNPEYYTSEIGVISITNRETALVGFKKLFGTNASAVAIVNEQGKLVGNLSVTDLRGITNETLNTLRNPVLEYLALRCETKEILSPVTCKAQDSFISIMKKAVENRIHRVWIVNDSFEPVGVHTLSDFCRVSLKLD